MKDNIAIYGAGAYEYALKQTFEVIIIYAE
ncbi:MAG: hypothetical protein BWY02_01563 [bacterium ADurb.Bin157]|jgi:hypothetical protein|nr:MAG: hypothetical protein BWY02_01563 [bacterium ADurb.Bin157]